MAGGQRGQRLEHLSAARALLDRCGLDLFLLNNEVDKLAAASGYTTIDSDLVSRMAARSLEADVFDMVRLVQAKKSTLAFRKLEELPTGGKTPLGEALVTVGDFMTSYSRSLPGESCYIVLITDGRANVPLREGADANEEASLATLDFTVRIRRNGTDFGLNYRDNKDLLKVTGFSLATAGTRTATITYEEVNNLSVTFTYTVLGELGTLNGSGTAEDPYEIASAESFLTMVSGGEGKGDGSGYYELVADIDFSTLDTEDLQSYPRDLAHDEALLESLGADVLFYPAVEEMYAPNACTWVTVEGLTAGLCGRTRPTHFRGVCTVVSKLMNIVMPDKAFFGQKDAQQLAVVRRMVRDLNMAVEVVGCPIVREADGLAKSSRNTYLSPAEREAALVLSRAVFKGEELVRAGAASPSEVVAAMRSLIEAEPAARIDYVEAVDAESIEPVDSFERDVLFAMAVYIGKTRLIDNFIAKAR